MLCFPALYFAGTAGKSRKPRCGQHLALLSGGEMLNKAISVSKSFRVTIAKSIVGHAMCQVKTRKSQNRGFSTATTQQLPIAVGIWARRCLKGWEVAEPSFVSLSHYTVHAP